MRNKDPFKQFLRDSGVKTTKSMLIMGLPYVPDNQKRQKRAKTTSNSPIPNKF